MAKKLSRREALTGMLLTGASAISLGHTAALANEVGRSSNFKTPDLTAAEIGSIESAIGKKGRYVEAENLLSCRGGRTRQKIWSNEHVASVT